MREKEGGLAEGKCECDEDPACWRDGVASEENWRGDVCAPVLHSIRDVGKFLKLMRRCGWCGAAELWVQRVAGGFVSRVFFSLWYFIWVFQFQRENWGGVVDSGGSHKGKKKFSL